MIWSVREVVGEYLPETLRHVTQQRKRPQWIFLNDYDYPFYKGSMTECFDVHIYILMRLLTARKKVRG